VNIHFTFYNSLDYLGCKIDHLVISGKYVTLSSNSTANKIIKTRI